MKLWYLAYKNMISKPLNLLLSLLLLSLSAALVTFVLQLSQQMEGQLKKNIAPFDMVVGAKGSPLQLVLSSVLHIDAPTGNIQWKELAELQQHPFVQTAIPVSYGDNYKGFRILGTTQEYFESYGAQLARGEQFQKPFEVVAGSQVARRVGLHIGDTFVSSHGLVDSGGNAHDDHPFLVKGILEPTGTVVDHLLITPLESIWEAHDHVPDQAVPRPEPDRNSEHEGESGHSEGHDDHSSHHPEESNEPNTSVVAAEHTEITSILLKFRSPLGLLQFPRYINENTTMQAALPGFEVQRLMELLGTGIQTIHGIALAILLVSGFSIFLSLLKTIRERRQEMALLRTYGLSTEQLLSLALIEGLLLAFLGFVSGWLLGRLGIWITSAFLQASYGYSLQINGPQNTELLLLGLIIVLAIFAALLASRSIFKLNVAKTLSDV